MAESNQTAVLMRGEELAVSRHCVATTELTCVCAGMHESCRQLYVCVLVHGSITCACVVTSSLHI